MKYSENALNIITTKAFKGIGRAWIVKNLQGNESVNEIVDLLNENSKQDTLISIYHFESKKEEIRNNFELLEESCDGIVAMGDNNFPKYRGNVKESERPIFLFYKGNLELLNLDNPNVAVIGLLDPDENIESRERKMVAELVKNNITIVSGLAMGCDSIAHKEALEGGKTVAILPSPLNNIMPAKHRSLAYQIVEEGGLLITEYYEPHKSAMDLSSRYKDRDRLQALYSDAIILAASYAPDSANRWNLHGKKLDSGARLAMEFAKNYELPRAVMYDEKNDQKNPMFDLNRQLLNEPKHTTIVTQKNLQRMISQIYNKIENIAYQPSLF